MAKPVRTLLPFSLLLTVFLASLWLGQAAKDEDAAATAKVYKVLIIDGQNNHQWAITTPVLRQALESSERFEVEVSTSPPKGADEGWDTWRPAFADYDAVLSNYNGELWPEPVRDAFEDYVKGGGAFVVVHAANNAFPGWPEYNEMIGLGGWGRRNEANGPYIYYKEGQLVRDDSKGRGGSHGKQWEFPVQIVDPTHPITKGMPETWKHAKDELYSELRGPARNMKVLATSPSKATKRDEPMIMVLEYGKGRVFHTPMGHADYSMQCEGFFTTLQRGTEWAITGGVTIPVPENFPGSDAVVLP